MDRRQEPRVETDQEVNITLVGEHPATYVGRVINFSGRGMRLVLAQPLPRKAPIRVDWNDSLLLGEVCYNAQQGDHYAVGLTLDQALLGVAELSQLARAIGPLDEPVAEEPVTSQAAFADCAVENGI